MSRDQRNARRAIAALGVWAAIFAAALVVEHFA